MTWHCPAHGYAHGDSPPCPPENERPRLQRLPRCPGCQSLWCARVTSGYAGLTPPACSRPDVGETAAERREKRRAS